MSGLRKIETLVLTEAFFESKKASKGGAPPPNLNGLPPEAGRDRAFSLLRRRK
jgi:hypothetical protein